MTFIVNTSKVTHSDDCLTRPSLIELHIANCDSATHSNTRFFFLDLATIGQIYLDSKDPSTLAKMDEIFLKLCEEQQEKGLLIL